MRLLRSVILFLSLGLGSACPGQADHPDTGLPERAPAIGYADALILGLVEGITEYLPVSSTGHLILTNQLLGLNEEVPLYNRSGELILREDDGEAIPFTLKQAADGYVIIIQGGAILAVAILYGRRLFRAFIGGIGWGLQLGGIVLPPLRTRAARFDPGGIALARNLVVAFLPAAVLGLLLDDLIGSYLFGVLPVVAALFVGGVAMLFVEKRFRRTDGAGPDLEDLTLRQCLTIGFLQCVAMWPGTSRSMMTIVGGYIVGLRPALAAEFSFLLGFITLTAASAYRALQMGGTLLEAVPAGPIVFGILIATLSAALAIQWLVGYLTRHGLGLFAWYRIVFAGLLLVFYLT